MITAHEEADAPLTTVAAAFVGDRRLREVAPLLGPLAVIESVRTRPVAPVAFTHAKVIHIMAGASKVRTTAGERMLTAGDAMVLGRGVRPDKNLVVIRR
ncbi:MAG: hypothetical protein R2722_07155 [Tessaracoccus sp.]